MLGPSDGPCGRAEKNTATEQEVQSEQWRIAIAWNLGLTQKGVNQTVAGLSHKVPTKPSSLGMEGADSRNQKPSLNKSAIYSGSREFKQRGQPG